MMMIMMINDNIKVNGGLEERERENAFTFSI